MPTTLTLSPLRGAFLISKYLIASCYVNDARLKYKLQHTLCSTVLTFCGDSQFCFFFCFFFYPWIIEVLCRHGAKKRVLKAATSQNCRITLLNARVKCQHYHTLLIGCFISSLKIQGFHIMSGLLGFVVPRHDTECKYEQSTLFLILFFQNEKKSAAACEIRQNSF